MTSRHFWGNICATCGETPLKIVGLELKISFNVQNIFIWADPLKIYALYVLMRCFYFEMDKRLYTVTGGRMTPQYPTAARQHFNVCSQ